MIAADGRRATGFAPSGPGGRLGERGLLRHRSRLGGGEIDVDVIAVGIVKVHLDGAQRGQHADTVRQAAPPQQRQEFRSEEHTSELQSLMRISYAVFCLKKKTKKKYTHTQRQETTNS